MTFVPKNEYNEMCGIETTEIGRSIVASKARKDMLTVVEFFKDEKNRECIQPRTLNLATLTSLKVAA